MIDVYVDLVFCNDSVLRVKSYHNEKEIHYPLLDLQTYYGEDESFIVRFFKQNVSFEQGTTLANVILALEPWQNIISKLTDRNVNAYCTECKKPSDANQIFSFLEISKSASFSRHYEYPSFMECEDFNAFFNNKNNRVKTNLFNIDTGTSMCGFNDGDNNNYSICHVAFHEIKNTPIIFTTQQKNLFFDKELNYLAEQIDGYFIDKNKITACYSPAKLNLTEAISAIFIDGLFYHWPMTQTRSDAFNQEIKEAMTEFDTEEKVTKLTVVDEEYLSAETTTEDQGKKVQFASGAFDGLIEHETENARQWDEIHNALLNNSRLKIGSIVISTHKKSFLEQ